MLRQKFINTIKKFDKELKPITLLVLAIKLQSGAIEIITNCQEINSKIQYIMKAYDDNMCLKTNTEIKILDFIIL